MTEQELRPKRTRTRKPLITINEPEEIRFDDLPRAMTTALNDLKEIKQQLATLTSSTDRITATEAAEYLQISKISLYKMINKDVIPYERRGRVYFFSRSALKTWMQSAVIRHRNK